MTCIAAVVHGDTVYIGGDSAGTNGHMQQTIRSDQKVFRNGPFVIGFAGSFRMGQVLRYSFTPPKVKDESNIMRYMVNDFVNAAQRQTTESRIEGDWEFLVGWRGVLFDIQMDWQVGVPHDDVYAIGIGSDIATGSLYSTSGDPRKRLLTALEASARSNATVRGPFTILSTTRQ